MTPQRKILLVGWDSADWRLISPLLDRGLMPALSGVIERGVMGNLASLEPMLSPLIWTSIATGKFPHQHGVLGFVEPDPLGGGIRNVGSTTRRGKALWNLLSESGLATHVVSWYASHPAETIRGVCASDRFALAPTPTAEPWPLPEGAIQPAAAAAALAQFRLHPTEIEASQLLPFIPRAAELDQRDPAVAGRLTALARILAQTASVQAAATWILETQPWDFLGVYFRALDDLGHHFMPFRPPCLPGVSETDVAVYGNVMEAACCFHDLMLARLLHLAGPDTTVIVISDHGFESGAQRPGAVANEPETMSGWHRQFGILAAAGPGVRRDERIYGCSVLDLTPTVLHLFGLPVGRDMAGKVLVNALEVPGEVARIPTWENPASDAAPAVAAPANAGEEAALFEHLVALGYMQRPDADTERQMRRAADEITFNRITSLVSAGQAGEASVEARRLAERNPTERRHRLKLVQALLHAGHLSEARDELAAVETELGHCPNTGRMIAHLLMLEGNPAEALRRLQAAESEAPDDMRLHEQIGRVLLQQRRWRDAEQRYRRVLAAEPENPSACVGLAAALARQNHNVEAVQWALTALGLQHFLPEGHFQLGAVLTKLNFPERAIQAFETGLSMRPGHVPAHRFLARLYRHIGRTDRAAHHRQRIRELDPSAPAED